jgi:UDP-glucuronate 4-epimerase
MKILVTGAAGFIGLHVCLQLLKKGHHVVGLDNLNAYYDINLKLARLQELGIAKENAILPHQISRSERYGKSFNFIKMAIEDRQQLPILFKNEGFDVVCNLAAQAGVRYSIENPESYIDSNIVGFLNVLECCRNYQIQHLVYASSSSVYGSNTKIPFETTDPAEYPISLYAASKKSNELMAHTYSHLYGFATTGLRFFTVYGPWGRPDMAMFLFTDAIINDKPIKVFNKGNMERDFTYIDDITEGVVRVIEKSIENRKVTHELYKLYNIGNTKAVRLLDFIQTIEHKLNKEAKKEFLPMQDGDVASTWANVDALKVDYGYSPSTTITEGVGKFVDWFREFYGVQSAEY